MYVIKRNGDKVLYDKNKILSAVSKAYLANDIIVGKDKLCEIIDSIPVYDGIGVEEIQDAVEHAIDKIGDFDVAKSYAIYREKHKDLRFVKERSEYIDKCSESSDNTATLSEVDENANVSNKNVATIECEVYKSLNKQIQRYKMKKQLQKMYPEVADQYAKDLESHVIYVHDEASSPIPKPYCVAVNLYPFLQDGTSTLDNLKSSAPKNLTAFCGQLNNLVFLLSSQFKGAVAIGEFFNALFYYCRKDFGDKFWLHDDKVVYKAERERTISDLIEQAFQNIVYSWNQPAGNRSFQSPFTNISYFDSGYWHALFDEFYYPDMTKPEWDGVNYLQQKFMRWFNKEREKTLLTFPVESLAMLSNGKDIIDKEYKNLAAEMWANGHSFFCYISDNPDSLSSCCFSKDTKVLWKNSYDGVKCTTLEELYNMKWEPYKKNLRFYHNGSWVKGKPIKLPNRKMYEVTTKNNKKFVVSDNHINVTYRGEIRTDQLTTDDYLMFNTQPLEVIKENDEHLTYNQGLLVGMFIGDGSFDNYICEDGITHTICLSLNKEKYEKALPYLSTLCEVQCNTPHNNVYPVRLHSKELVEFIMKWTGNTPKTTYTYNKHLNINCVLQSKEFRQGILDGWYLTDGGNTNRCYTTSKQLVEDMEILITSLGKQCIIDISDRTDEAVVIRGQEFNRNHPLYCIRWYSDSNSRVGPESGFKWKNNSIFWKITSIKEVDYKDDIYCLEMSNQDDPYFTLPCGLITHNCRLRNAIDDNEFSFTNGLTGVATGSINVITLNINRIVQDCSRSGTPIKTGLVNILDRVYKYHKAYRQQLKDLYDEGMLPVYKAGYISLRQQFSTIGLNGINEAAEFLGLRCNDNEDYKKFVQLITSTISEENRKHSTNDCRFNQEFVPAEALGIKNYNWDKQGGYVVPNSRNCYNSYIYEPDDDSISILERFRLQGKDYTGKMDGGVALHCNLQEHLTKKQYLDLIDYAIKYGVSYFTFNIPNSQCNDCGFIAKRPLKECPKCGSKNITWWTRIIGYLRPIPAFSKGRQIEASRRVYL